MHTVFLLLGSNMGDKLGLLQQACLMIGQQVGTIVCASSFYESEAWGFDSPERFINQAIKVETLLSPMQLLATTQQIEKALGREQKSANNKYTSRTIDIDILFYDNQIVEQPDLQIPHKHLHERRFALAPLCEIAPALEHPRFGKTISALLSECTDKSEVDLMKI